MHVFRHCTKQSSPLWVLASVQSEREMVRGCRYASNLEVRVDATLSMTHLSALIAGGANVIISCLCNTRGYI